jgi:hypothetical protein
MNSVTEDSKKRIWIENGMYLDAPKKHLIWLQKDIKKWRKRKLNSKMKWHNNKKNLKKVLII